MRKLFKRSEEESNSWQSYTDLMAGFLAIFIIAAVIGVVRINKFLETVSDGKMSSDEIKVSIEQHNQITSIHKAIKSIDASKYFYYNDKYRRIEYKKNILFEPLNPLIPLINRVDLVDAGIEIAQFIKKWSDVDYLGFKVIIEGRTANSHDNPVNKLHRDSKVLSYQRALSLYYLWHENGIIDELNKNPNVELFISGAGMEGKGRYTGLGVNGEDRNKLFIIQIVPYLIVK